MAVCKEAGPAAKMAMPLVEVHGREGQAAQLVVAMVVAVVVVRLVMVMVVGGVAVAMAVAMVVAV